MIINYNSSRDPAFGQLGRFDRQAVRQAGHAKQRNNKPLNMIRLACGYADHARLVVVAAAAVVVVVGLC